jgi:hypothetical protein
LKNKIGEITKSKLSLTNQLEQILESNCCKDLKEFELGLRNKNIYDETIIEYNSKKELLNKILIGWIRRQGKRLPPTRNQLRLLHN